MTSTVFYNDYDDSMHLKTGHSLLSRQFCFCFFKTIVTFTNTVALLWVYMRHHATVRAATTPFKIAML